MPLQCHPSIIKEKTIFLFLWMLMDANFFLQFSPFVTIDYRLLVFLFFFEKAKYTLGLDTIQMPSLYVFTMKGTTVSKPLVYDWLYILLRHFFAAVLQNRQLQNETQFSILGYCGLHADMGWNSLWRSISVFIHLRFHVIFSFWNLKYGWKNPWSILPKIKL